ncbi:Queuine tRNA-ribosyltransferase subunit qtrtd1 [Podila humilis]|nr:Queuine tRNA-ribosyltransferase subunit qtrtd1 [Podila humilis]
MLTFDLHSKIGLRRGRITIPNTDNHAIEKRVIETPGCLMYTSKGSVPHLTPDNLRLQDFGGVNVTMEHLLQNHHPPGLQHWPGNLAHFLHLEEFVVLCQLRDTSTFTKLAPNTNRYVTLTTFQGIRQLTLEDYLSVIRVYRPDIAIAYTDNIAETFRDPATVLPGKKRVEFSVDRSLTWLDKILLDRSGQQSHQTVQEPDTRKRESKKEQRMKARQQQQQLETQPPSGTYPESISPSNSTAPPNADVKHSQMPWTGVNIFAQLHGSDLVSERIRSAQETAKRDVQGFVMDVSALVHSNTMTKNAVLNCVKVSAEHLPVGKPRLLYGIQTPEDVLKAIPMGIDLFDTSYPFHLTEDGKASLYYFKSPAITGSSTTTSIDDKRWINLWDKEHADKFVPLLNGCECYACKGGRHTRAYINHLLKTHEMLATVLLMNHNMHQFSKFFASIRQSIEAGTFEKDATLFHSQFGVEPFKTGQMHEEQAIVEASLTRRANRLESAEEGEMDAIGSAPSPAGITLPQKRHSEDANGTHTSSVSIGKDEVAEVVKVNKTRQPRKKLIAISGTTIESLSVKTTATKSEIKVKPPAEDPWKKRPRHVPSYAKEALDHLCKVDPALARLVEKHPYEIYMDHDTNYFRVLSRTILGQQIHWKAARSIIFKFVSHYFPGGNVTVESLDEGDKSFPTPQQVLATPMDQLRQCGLSERKASYIQDLAQHFVDGKITFTDKATLQALTDQELAAQLLCVRGIGPWTVDMFLMDSLERLDVLPTLDLGVRKGMEKHFACHYMNGIWGAHLMKGANKDESGDSVKKTVAKGKGKAKKGEMTCEDMERMAEVWRPYRSIASWYMWRAADEDTITAPI